MFERFTDRARECFNSANRVALQRGHDVMMPMDVMTAIARNPDWESAKFLASKGADLQALADRDAAAHGGVLGSTLRGKLGQAPVIKEAIQAAIGIHRELNADAVSDLHVVQGLLATCPEAVECLYVLTPDDEFEITVTNSQSVIDSARAPEPLGAYAFVRRAGGLLFLAGIGPRRRGSKDIPGVTLDATGGVATYDIALQVRSCFDNVRAVLEEAGSSWGQIVDVTVFLTDMKRDFEVYNRLWAEYFPPGPNSPTRTTVEIKSLPQAGNAPINFEVKVVAMA